MRRIKLSGRERAVLKAVGFAEGAPGAELLEHTQMPADDLTDVLNALLAAGYSRANRIASRSASRKCRRPFEVNPGYVHELRESMARAWV